MALFGKKTKDEEEVAVKEASQTSKKVKKDEIAIPHDKIAIVMKPRITEKASVLLERNIYTFEVKKGATKHEIRDAIVARYKVTPLEIRIVNNQPRRSMSSMRGRMVKHPGLRKAYVYLKEGDRIDLI